ncbi:MAG: HNH endonuclease [Actinobacteria bacterium]|nr:HNH endonuclease [Actinomycetota bacterium]
MGSLYLARLSDEEKNELKHKLLESQGQKCFICEKPLDISIQEYEIDHIIPVSIGGKDDITNMAITHSTCNESKQDSDLRVARVLARFGAIRDACFKNNRGVNLDDILKEYGGSKYELSIVYDETRGMARYSFSDIGCNDIYETKVFEDDLSGFKYFFGIFPIEYVFHDDRINPRSIGQNISKLVKEFFLKRPQLHVPLGWIDLTNNRKERLKVFDGQHKAAAQVLLGVRKLPVRVFINPDIDTLLTTNTNAGTTLRQVAFDKSVQRHLGSALYYDRVERYRKELGLAEDDLSFSESDLVRYFKGESREMKRYILDNVRDYITHHQDNKLKDYIDFGGRGKEKPLSYSTVEKTFYSFFIFQDVMDNPLDYMQEEGENPRDIEREQILQLMNIIAEEIFINKFDPVIGTSKIEHRIQKGEDIPEPHLIAYRMSKEEILYNWLGYISQIAKNYFIMQGKPITERKLFQYRFPPALWDRIRVFIRNLRNLPCWVNKELSSTVFGGKQNYDFWQAVFETGCTPQGLQVLAAPLNLMEMIKEE